jgi:O-antigen ligase
MATLMPSLTSLLDLRFITFGLTFCGYGVISFFISSSESSQLLTIPYRAIVIVLNLCLLSVNINSSASSKKKNDGINTIKSILQRKSFFLALFLFLFIYSYRIVFEIFIRQSNYLIQDSATYLLFWFFISLIPGLNYLFLDSNRSKQYLSMMWMSHLMIGLETILMNPSNQSEFYLANDRAANLALNPISLGHYGASLCIMSFFSWRNYNSLNDQRSTFTKILYLIATFIGLYVTLIAASRGPLIGLLICLSLVIITDNKAMVNKITGISGIMLLVSVFVITFFGDIDFIINRFFLLSDEIETATDLSRGSLYLASITLILENPFLGFGVELPDGLGYPHNLIVESFLSLGLLGGILFTVLFIITLVQSLKLLANRDNHWGWLGLIFIQYATGSMFSGSLYASSSFWYLMFGVNGISLALDRQWSKSK